MQTTSQILMIRPVNFRFNTETAVNNSFQVAGQTGPVQQQAEQEFDTFVRILSNEGVAVQVINDTPDIYTPDSIFPNNWISFHEDGTLFLYPMFAQNRRLERKPGVLHYVRSHFSVRHTIDLTGYEGDQVFLEGTGSMVLDRVNRIAYACLSPRTHPEALERWCGLSGYRAHTFHATDENNREIYHTNVMMAIADRYAVVCLESVKNPEERESLTAEIAASGKTVVPITLDQMNRFAGNMLQVNNEAGEKLLVMSTQAYASLNREQVKLFHQWNRIVHAPLYTIEANGGGSARCMMAEIHLPPVS